MTKRSPRNSDDRTGRDAAAAPTRDEILDFLTRNPDRASRRDIARAFSMKGEARAALKSMLAEMKEAGLIEKRRNRLLRPGRLPHVSLLDIYGRDEDGSLLARPTEWTGGPDEEPPVVVIRSAPAARGKAPGIGLRVLARTFPAEDPAGPAYTGRVIKLIEKQRQTALGVLRSVSDDAFRLEPVDRRQPELRIRAADIGKARPGDLVEVEQARGRGYGIPSGRVVSVIGNVASEKSISMIALHQHEIPHIFPDAVLAEAENAQSVDQGPREDWRDLPLVTIDPEDAKDHDDAVFAAADEDSGNPGGFVVVVAIADVAAYVLPASAMDKEALRRGNSVYFPDRVVPMLPERISNVLCSLREEEDRPAMAVRMRFDASGRKLQHRFHRIVMRSRARLSYTQTQRAIDGAPDSRTSGLLEPVLRPLWSAYRAVARAREAREPLDLDLPERKVLLKEDGTVDRVLVPDRLEAHRLIEEFMILANVAAAETLEEARQPLIYRVHDTPSLAKQEALREFLSTIGEKMTRTGNLRPAQFNAILRRAKGSELEQLVNEIVLRSQSQAEYSPYNIGHFGLNLRRYAHFTSPIRRYADLVVHRSLISALGLGDGGVRHADPAGLEEIAGLVSASERRAMAAERDTIDRLVAAYLSQQVGSRFPGRISGVTRAGLFVRLHQIGADGFVPVSSLGDEYYVYDEAAHALAGRNSGKGYRLGDSVEVRLAEVSPMAGTMNFEMLSEPRPMPASVRSRHKDRAGGRRRDRGRSRSRR